MKNIIIEKCYIFETRFFINYEGTALQQKWCAFGGPAIILLRIFQTLNPNLL